MVFVNPVFIERDGMQLEEEGCLSVRLHATVARPQRAGPQGLDRNGDEREVEGKDCWPAPFQHEMITSTASLPDRCGARKRDPSSRKSENSRAGKW